MPEHSLKTITLFSLNFLFASEIRNTLNTFYHSGCLPLTLAPRLEFDEDCGIKQT